MKEDKFLNGFMFVLIVIALFFGLMIVVIDHFRPHLMDGARVHVESSSINMDDP